MRERQHGTSSSDRFLAGRDHRRGRLLVLRARRSRTAHEQARRFDNQHVDVERDHYEERGSSDDHAPTSCRHLRNAGRDRRPTGFAGGGRRCRAAALGRNDRAAGDRRRAGVEHPGRLWRRLAAERERWRLRRLSGRRAARSVAHGLARPGATQARLCQPRSAHSDVLSPSVRSRHRHEARRGVNRLRQTVESRFPIASTTTSIYAARMPTAETPPGEEFARLLVWAYRGELQGEAMFGALADAWAIDGRSERSARAGGARAANGSCAPSTASSLFARWRRRRAEPAHREGECGGSRRGELGRLLEPVRAGNRRGAREVPPAPRSGSRSRPGNRRH